ncbi:MAG: hypothetical protein ACPLRW_06670 [Moorellales bacterium]
MSRQVPRGPGRQECPKSEGMEAKLSVEDRERLFRIARLMLELGAEARRCLATVELVFRPQSGGGRPEGLVFTENLFAVGMDAVGSLLTYRVGRSGFKSACTLQHLRSFSRRLSDEADLERGVFPPRFWDSVYRTVRRLRPVLFRPAPRRFGATWELMAEVRRRHKWSPTRETLFLQRRLQAFVDEEWERVRSARRRANAAKRAAYEEMLRLAAQAPHSLNRLRAAAGPVGVKRIAGDIWEVWVTAGGRRLSTRGTDPLSAAWELLIRLPQNGAGLAAGVGEGVRA